ncbi:hypothetical protein [Lachnobacterium bovis]|nr:hypothetical protein [Lachnobacterium bovis]
MKEYSVDYQFLRNINEIYESKMRRFINAVETYIQNDEMDEAYKYLSELYNDENKLQDYTNERYTQNEYINYIIENYIYKLRDKCYKVNVNCDICNYIEKTCNINKLVEFLAISFEILENDIEHILGKDDTTLLKVWIDIKIDNTNIQVKKVGMQFKAGLNQVFSSINISMDNSGNLEAFKDGKDYFTKLSTNKEKLGYLYENDVIPPKNYEILKKIFSGIIECKAKYEVIKTKNSFYTELIVPIKSLKKV